MTTAQVVATAQSLAVAAPEQEASVTQAALAPTMEGDRCDIIKIMEMIPHRYPLLMIDRVQAIKPHESALGIKNVTINEPYFSGHFPKMPVMPGVLIIESMAQTAAVLVVYSLGKEFEGKLVYFMSVEDAKFRRPVMPGAQLELQVQKLRSRGNVWKFTGVARVDGVVVAEATYSAMIVDS